MDMSSSKFYTAEEDAVLHAHYATTPTTKLRNSFLPGRSIAGIRFRAWKLGIKKDPEVIDYAKTVVTMIGHLPENERYYLAGIFDGEGYVGLRVDAKGVCRFYASITTTSPNLLAWLKARLLGNAYMTNKPRLGRKTRYDWIISGNRRVILFCKEIAPYLVIKQRQAELVAQGYLRFSHTERRNLAASLASMKKTD